jgi:SpoVK/Ycf46/Vps4 family AAA+-type ATPase
MAVVRIPSPDAEGQAQVWQRMLAAPGTPGDEELARRLAERYRLTPGSIARAVTEARAQAVVTGLGPEHGALGLADLGAAVARGIAHELTSLAEPISTRLSWDDVILPADLRATLREVVAHATLQPLVFRTWGFARKFEYGRGLACLFSGPPGTGKTMMAGILARELGRDLYRVDLSRITSKWIGETEKNLSRVFAEADKAQVILLFDEADSLFAKRTQVQTSNDRFANAEVNYLLQRMESYDGITILTTNFDKEMDDAFKRRLRFKIRFPMPDEAHRQRLWATMLPSTADVADSVDFVELARRFELSGGSIKNAVLRAAFMAASEGKPIGNEHLAQAASAEAREMGVLVRG